MTLSRTIFTVVFFALAGASGDDLTPILQGVTTDSKVGFVANYKRNTPVIYKVRNKTTGLTIDPVEVLRTETLWSRQVVDKVYFSSLSHVLEYELLLIHPDGREEVREFKLLNPFQRDVRIAMVSCSSYLHRSQYGIWNHLIDSDPDLVIFGGDNVYAGLLATAIPRRIWKIYHLTRDRFPIFRSKKLFPTLAIWDDHDFGKNNGGKNFRFKKEATDIFNTFYAQDFEYDEFSKGPGISSHFKFFGLNILFLDNRSFYQESGVDHWGEEQRDWISTKLDKFTDPTMIVNGVQFFGDYAGSESVETDHPHRLQWLLGEVEASASKIFFASGDRHYSEVMTVESLPYTTYEITSSGMHTAPHSVLKENPRRLDIYNSDNFMLLDLVVEKHSVDIDYAIIDKNGDTVASKVVRVPSENLSSD